jgi:hypothetical protein
MPPPVKTKEDLKAVAETGFSLTPPGRVYEIGKGAVDLVDDFKSGNFEKTANNITPQLHLSFALVFLLFLT